MTEKLEKKLIFQLATKFFTLRLHKIKHILEN